MTESYKAKFSWSGVVDRTNPARELVDSLAGLIPNNSTFGIYNIENDVQWLKKTTTLTFGSTSTKNRVKIVLEEVAE